jgi:UDP-2,3-diacylglucosamine pyrophosphatase LpxH
LQEASFQRLILLGDIFQDLNFSRLTEAHWDVVEFVRTLSTSIEVVLIEGNHDAGIAPAMHYLLPNVRVYKEYEWDWNGRKCIAIHGHQYDNLWAEGTPFLGRVFTPLYLQLQKIELVNKWLPQLIDKLHTHWERLTPKVADKALHRAAQAGAQYIFCGHTHFAYHRVRDGVEYWNTGDWTGAHGTYITLGSDGVHLRNQNA